MTFIGYIYKLTGSCGNVYIGSTINYYNRRYQHNTSSNKTCSKNLKKPLQFEVIRKDEYKLVKTMHLVEQYYIDMYKCVNKKRAYTNPFIRENLRKECYEKNKETYHANKEEINKQQREKYNNNEDLRIKAKARYEKNKNINKEEKDKKQKETYQANKEEINKKQREKYKNNEDLRIKAKARYQKNKNINKEEKDKKYQANKEQINQRQRELYQLNKEKRKIHCPYCNSRCLPNTMKTHQKGKKCQAFQINL